jgi:hypothetical protein
MKGEIEELPPITIKTPNKSNTDITGINQNFFLSIKNLHKSFKNSITSVFKSLH